MSRSRGPYRGARVQPNQIASARAHELLAELISLGINLDKPITAAAKCEGYRLQVIVTLAEYEPMRLEAGERPTPATVKLPPLHAKIVALLSKDVPRKGEWIAAKLHRAYSGSFRSALADLVAFGVLLKANGGGYLLA